MDWFVFLPFSFFFLPLFLFLLFWGLDLMPVAC